jgi:YfiH family protein
MADAGTLPPPGIKRRGRLTVWSPPVAADWPGVQLLVTTRLGGVSPAPWDSLNLSPSTGDEREDVERNRELLQREAATPDFLWLHQVHGDVVVEASVLESIPGGTLQADGLWTRQPGRALVVGVADCVPVFLWAPDIAALAVVHAGWRGTVQGILKRGVACLQQAGAQARNLHMALGPSIGPCCYEVGDEVVDQLPDGAVLRRPDATFADLRAANRDQAVQAGLLTRNIFAEPPCTACHDGWFYSHRRQGPITGRMWAVGWLTAP